MRTDTQPIAMHSPDGCSNASGNLWCSSCNFTPPSGAKFCPQCGRPATMPPPPREAERASGLSATKPLAAPAVAVTEPANEGKEDLFGYGSQTLAVPKLQAPPVQQQAATPQCRKCGWDLPQGGLFCPGCAEPVGGAPAARLWLTRVRPNGTPSSTPLTGEQLVVGKAEDCDLVLADDAYVSRRHLRVREEDGLMFLEDLGSANGTLLRIRRPIIIEPGDEILAGTTVLRLEQRAG